MAKKVLCLFDYVARTGYGTVSKNIVKEVKKHFGKDLKLDIVAINYFGESYHETEDIFVTSARLNDVDDDPFGRFFFLKVLKESNEYDGIFIMQDLGIIQPIIELLQHIKKEKKENNRKSFKSIFYFPVDCRIVDKLVENIEFFDLLATYTQYGKNEVLRYKPELKTKIKIVPHGNNIKDFYPLPKDDVQKFREAYFGENHKKFIITNVNRNQPRKDIVSTIFGFIEAKSNWDKNLPEPFLYLHCHPKDPLGWDIRGVMLQTELVEDKDYKLLPKEYEDTMVEVEVLNKIYNSSDVYITTTLGEGWGLTLTEAMATKVPIICPMSTSFIEMSENGKNVYGLKTLYPYCNSTDNVIREQVDIYEVSDLLQEVAADTYDTKRKKELDCKIERSFAWVSKHTWDKVCKSWVEYFRIY